MTVIATGTLEIAETRGDPGERDSWGSCFSVLQADPVIQVTAEWLELIRCHMMSAAVLGLEPRVTIRAGVLTVQPSNGGCVIYREVAWDEDRNVYLFAWPD